MFTSRGPRNPEEIAACVSLYRHSPFWADSELTESDMVECWEALLIAGIGLIDIIETEDFIEDLKNTKKAVSDPHYRHGFFQVVFVCYVTSDVAYDILNTKSDNVDALLYFLQRFNTYRKDSSASRPIPKISSKKGEKGRLDDESFYLFACGVYHPEVSFHWSRRTERYLDAIHPFSERVIGDMIRGHIGFRHDAYLLSVAGAHLVTPYTSTGLNIARRHSEKDNYIFITTRDPDVLATLKVLPADLGDELKINLYRPLFLEDSVRRTCNLTRYQQQVCSLLLLGFTLEQVGGFLDPVDYEKIMSIEDPTVRKSTRESLKKRIAFQQNQASKALRDKMLVDSDQDGSVPLEHLLTALKRQDGKAAHEIRQFIFSVYPWPEFVPSRR